ncbi:MAG: ABC transporter substrate-binding protein [Pelagimonas sp.]|uniref:ABC transporter substrate-binding protein n=1 Tax=Pelagimonas sp. TaxID=2073170 RepID=UPI003D6BF1A0
MNNFTKAVFSSAIALMTATQAYAETKIAIGFTSLADNAANLVAIEKGFFEKHGIEPTAISLRSGSVVVPGIVSGEIQVGTLTAPTFIQTLDGGLGLAIITGLSETNAANKNSGLIVRDDSGIDSVADLAGKSLGVGSVGSIITVATREWLRLEGIDTANTKLIETPMGQLGDTLRTGNFDFTTLPEPLLSRAISGGGVKQIANPFASLPEGKPVMVNVVSKAWAEENPEAAKSFQMAIQEATVWALDNQEEAQEIIAQYLGLDPEKVKQTQFPTITDTASAEDMRWWVSAMEDQKMLRSEVDPAQEILQ